MIIASFVFTLLAFYLPGIIIVIIDEIFDRPRSRDIPMIWGKIHVVGVIATYFGITIMSRESLLGEGYFDALLESDQNFDALILLYLPSLLASIPLALLVSLGWAFFFHGKIVDKFMRKIAKIRVISSMLLIRRHLSRSIK